MNSIAELRKKSEISQADLANKINQILACNMPSWSGGIISHYETGKRVPSLERSRLIVRALNELGCNCTLDDVFPPKEKAA